MLIYIAYALALVGLFFIIAATFIYFRSDVKKCYLELKDVKSADIEYYSANSLLKDFYYKNEFTVHSKLTGNENKQPVFKRDNEQKAKDDIIYSVEKDCPLQEGHAGACKTEPLSDKTPENNACEQTAPLYENEDIRTQPLAETAPLYKESNKKEAEDPDIKDTKPLFQ